MVSLGLSQLPGFEAVSLYSVKNGFVVAEASFHARKKCYQLTYYTLHKKKTGERDVTEEM